MHILLGLLIAFVVVAIFAKRMKGVRQCRWRRDATGDKGSLQRYTCVACGVEAFTATGKAPDQCKAANKPPSL